MKVCKIKPSHSACSACIDMAMMFDECPDCGKCGSQKEYELIETHCSFLNSYAVIIKDGKLEKVDMSRVYDIRDKEGAEERK